MLKTFLKKLTHPLSFIMKTFPLMFWVACLAQSGVYQEHLLSAVTNGSGHAQHVCDCWGHAQGKWRCGAELKVLQACRGQATGGRQQGAGSRGLEGCRLSEPGMGAAALVVGGRSAGLGESPVWRGIDPWLCTSFSLCGLSLAWACPRLSSLSCYLYNFIPTAYKYILSTFLCCNPQKWGWALIEPIF